MNMNICLFDDTIFKLDETLESFRMIGRINEEGSQDTTSRQEAEGPAEVDAC